MYNIFRKFFRKDEDRKQPVIMKPGVPIIKLSPEVRANLPKMNISEEIKRDFQISWNVILEDEERRKREGLPPRRKRYGPY